MEGSVVDAMVVLQPGTIVPPAKYIPSGQVWGGSPAQFVRNLTHDEVCCTIYPMDPPLSGVELATNQHVCFVSVLYSHH